MTNYREILRLHSLGLNKTEIASSCRCARNTVAANCGLQWPLSEEMSDKQLSERLFPSSTSTPVYKMPDYEWVHREMQKNGVTLSLLWVEYCERCRANGELPYQSTQFNKYYADFVHKTTAIFLLGEKQTVSNGIKQDGSMVWMQHRPQMRIRPLFADTGILRMVIANTNTRGPSLEKMRTSLPIMVPELLP